MRCQLCSWCDIWSRLFVSFLFKRKQCHYHCYLCLVWYIYLCLPVLLMVLTMNVYEFICKKKSYFTECNGTVIYYIFFISLFFFYNHVHKFSIMSLWSLIISFQLLFLSVRDILTRLYETFWQSYMRHFDKVIWDILTKLSQTLCYVTSFVNICCRQKMISWSNQWQTG